MARALDTTFVLTYAQPPSDSVLKAVISAHEHVRQLLGNQDYETFLQGSYKNDTALKDMNDVDLVAVSRAHRVTASSTPAGRQAVWATITDDITARLQKEPRYRGRWTPEDKCIRLNTGVHVDTVGIRVDIVPAISVQSPSEDPIVIYSRKGNREKRNWPRGHHEGGRRKSDATSGLFKLAVRLFKRWRSCHFSSPKIAPSYYLECLLHSLPEKLFASDPASNFVAIAQEIGRRYSGAAAWSTVPLKRIVGDGNLLAADEWDHASFEQFRNKLATSVGHAERALREVDPERARSAWRAAFNGQ
jgi:hypothetical protein